MENKESTASLPNEPSPATDLQLRRLTLFSSGVGFYEYSGEITGSKELNLPFNSCTVNDALKSIVISDPDASPTVSYHAEQTLERALKGLSVDLHGNHHIAGLLNSLKGAEVEILTPTPLKGKIMLVEYRYASDTSEKLSKINEREAFLSLFTTEGIRIISLKEIRGFSFSDPKISADMNRALDLIMQSRDSDTKNLTVKLPGQKARKVSLSYVIPTPVWKVSYRLDLSKEKPFLQGWAIVDNDSDTDWEQVQLALVTGRPVSFTQNLYPPYHLSRPTLPLSIEGMAEARTYDSGTPKSASKKSSSSSSGRSDILSQSELDSLLCCMSSGSDYDEAPADGFSMMEGMLETADGRMAGDQFEYTVKNPVSLARQQSAMLPLVEGSLQAEKMLVFSANRATSKRPMNPAIGTELVNNTGMKLPAGSITVYDEGTYAGDSLIAFFPEGEKRIIVYGEDLSVTGSFSHSSRYVTSAVAINNGAMVFKQTIKYECVYTFRNATAETKRLIVEHPFSSDAVALVSPSSHMEKTSNLYRFELSLPSGELCFEVKEEEPHLKEIVLSSLAVNDFVRYTSDKELSQSVRAGLQQAVALLQKIDEEKNKLSAWQKQLKHLYGEQERTRKNLEAAGSQTQQGQYYLNLLATQENEILAANKAIADFEKIAEAAKQEYDTYIRKMCF